MKKLKIVGIMAAVVLIGGVVSIPLINNRSAYKVEKALYHPFGDLDIRGN